MRLDRDEFVVTFDSGKTKPDGLIALIREAGYTSYVATGDGASDDTGSSDGSLDDPIFTDALAQAKRENKPIVIDFMASWCVPCRRMEKETFTDPQVAKLLDQVVFLKVDTDEHPDLAKSFDVEGLPDIRFLNPDGVEVRRLTDFQDAELFADSLNALLSADSDQPGTTPPAADDGQALIDLAPNAAGFRHAFNGAAGMVRVVMLVSPG